MKEYILKSEDISAEEYMDNQELRDKYRAIYQGLINELEKDGAKGKLSFETTKEAIQRIVSSAGSILMYQEFAQAELARAQAGLREFAELKERYDAESSSSRQTKK